MAKLKAVKARSVYRCNACGHVEAKWLGKCPACQEWSSLVEEMEQAEAPRPSAKGVSDGQAPVPITEVGEISAKDRRATLIGELDRVLGGGLVAGSMVLLGGDPGVGKSTLLIQALAGLARDRGVLYATGEKSVAQTAMRARRVGAAAERLSLVAETDVERILAHAHASRPSILSDATEALFGAVFLDGGFEAARLVIERCYADSINAVDPNASGKDPKTRLQEWLQAKGMPLPEYTIAAIDGEAHRQSFTVSCHVHALKRDAIGRGSSRRAAEQDAARAILDELAGTGPT